VHFRISALAGDTPVLSGAEVGRELLGKLVAAARSSAEPELIFLDFVGVEVATASFLNSSVIAFRDHVRGGLPSLYPVVANAAPLVIEELEFILLPRRDALWACRLMRSGDARDTRLIGELDDAHRSTFEVVVELGSASAPILNAQSREKLAPTAWNNRLSNLAARGLLIESRQGRTKTFRPVFMFFDRHR